MRQVISIQVTPRAFRQVKQNRQMRNSQLGSIKGAEDAANESFLFHFVELHSHAFSSRLTGDASLWVTRSYSNDACCKVLRHTQPTAKA